MIYIFVHLYHGFISNRKSHEKRSKSINVRSETNDDDKSDSFRSPSTEVYRTHEKRILSSPAAKLIFGSELTESSPASSKKYPTFRGSIWDPNSSETTSLTEESEILKSGGKKRFNHILNRGYVFCKRIRMFVIVFGYNRYFLVF